MVTANPDGSLTFRIYNPHADEVAILGGFAPPPGEPMCREDGGWWRATLHLAPGDYTFRYIVNGQASIPDYAAGGLALDESGAWVSCLCVEPDERAAGAAGEEPRTLAITDSQLEMLLAGRRVELRMEGAGEGPVVLVRATRPAGGGAAPRAGGRTATRAGAVRAARPPLARGVGHARRRGEPRR